MNEMEMTITLRRIDVCDLLLACLAASQTANDGGKKWDKLHDEIRDQLHAFDDSEYNRMREEEETAERWEHEKYDDVDDDSILFR